MNIKVSEEFGQYFIRLPLIKKPNIIYDNALTVDWEKVVPKSQLNYILGNPPFNGARTMSKNQKADLKEVASEVKGSTGNLDFVTGWYIKASQYIRFTKIKVSLVSTNSIVQGEQALILWQYLMYQKDVVIHFAHQTFKWSNEARGKAAVYCVIIGFSCIPNMKKTLYTYANISGEPNAKRVKEINQYLLDAPTIFIKTRNTPISDVPKMIKGSTPIDNKNFLFSKKEMEKFIAEEPNSKKYFKEWYGGQELINETPRYALYLRDCPPRELRKMPFVLERVEAVREHRLKSRRPATNKWADFPTYFAEDRAILDSPILGIPEVSSERRSIIPVAFFKEGVLCSNKVFQIRGSDIYYFGILNSKMHMSWTNTICGRLKGDYSYSNTLVYNNFIFPSPTEKQKQIIEQAAKKYWIYEVNMREAH